MQKGLLTFVLTALKVKFSGLSFVFAVLADESNRVNAVMCCHCSGFFAD